VERGGAAGHAAAPKAGGFEALLSLARERGASDLFLAPGRRLLLRIHGSLVDAVAASPGAREMEALVAEKAGAHAVRALAESGSARFTAELEEGVRCLVRAARDRSGTTLAVRFLPAEAPSLESLGLPEGVSRLAGPAPGLLLVAGPPGSGRTSALAALAAHAAQARGERVVTVEDPVEIVIPPGRGSVSQREAGADVPSVLEGLRAAGTEDADVVLAGAVPDAASAALLVELAASGRLVLAAAPAPSLMLALQWLDAMLPEGRRVELRSLLAATFRGGFALALCKGRSGNRVAAAETLHPGSLVSELILSGGLAALPDHLRDASGYVPLNTSLSGLVAAGQVEPREALLRSLDRLALLARLREQGASLPPELHGALQGGAHEP
jgi:twitching motility protein PilT